MSYNEFRADIKRHCPRRGNVNEVLPQLGLPAIAIVFIPIQVTILWGNILALKEVFTPNGEPLGNGLAITITPANDRQRKIFKMSGKNSIYISSQMQEYDELVGIISEKSNLPIE